MKLALQNPLFVGVVDTGSISDQCKAASSRERGHLARFPNHPGGTPTLLRCGDDTVGSREPQYCSHELAGVHPCKEFRLRTPRRYRKNLACFFLVLCLVPVFAEETILFKDGGTLKCRAVSVDKEHLVLVLDHGSMKVMRTALAAATIAKYFGGNADRPEALKVSQPKETKEATKEVIKETPPEPPEGLPDLLPELHPTAETQNFSVEKITFEIASKIPGNEKVKIQALVPKDQTGKIPGSAANVVFYAPHIGDTNLHEKRTGHDQKMFWELCENFGLTVFTAEFKTNVADVDDQKKCYYYPESGSGKLVFDAREKLLRDNKLSKRKMFVVGNSGGSSLAERLGLLYPNDIAAVAMMGGGRFDPVRRPVDVPWLILNTRGDPRAPQNVELVQQLRANGMNALYAETEPWATKKEDFFLKQDDHNFHHTSSDLGFNLMKEFIVGAVAQQGDRIPKQLEPGQWPFSSSVTTPFLVRSASGDPGKKNPFADRLFFPSQDFANLWKTIPYRAFALARNQIATNSSTASAIVRYPPAGVPSKGIVVFNAGKDADIVFAGDYLDYMALRGYVGVSCQFSNSEKEMLEGSKNLVKETLKAFSGSTLPFYLVGLRSGGRHMILAGGDCQDSRIKSVLAVDAELDWPFPGLSPIEVLPSSKCTSFYLVSTSKSSSLESQIKTFQDVAATNHKSVAVSRLENIATTPELDGLDSLLNLLEADQQKEASNN